MISLIIIAILTMALIGTIGMNMLNLGNQTEQVVRTLEERASVIAIKNAIKQELKPVGINRKLALPVGRVSSSGYTTLPSTVSIENKNVWGMEYIYCPYSTIELTGTGNGTVQTAPTEGYNIQTVSYDGLEYIVSSTQPTIAQYNVLAVVISPIPSATTPQCEDVRFDTANDVFYTINYDGVVEVIREETSIISREPVSLNLLASDLSLRIHEEVDSWQVELPELYTVNLQSGDYVTDTIDFINPLSAKNKQITIVGDSSGVSRISASTIADLNFENVVVLLKDITIDNSVNISFINSDVFLDNVTISSFTADSSKIKSKGSVTLNASNPIVVTNSNIDLTGFNAQINKSNASIGLNLFNSKMVVDDLVIQSSASGGVGLLVSPLSSVFSEGNITLSGSSYLSGISVDSEASFTMDSGTVNGTTSMDTIIYNQGVVDVNNSIISGRPSINNAIVLGDGAEFNLSSSTVGSISSATVNGVVDLGGAKFISGESSTINTVSTCWSGDIFYLAPSINGTRSETTSTNYRMVNKSSWLCNN